MPYIGNTIRAADDYRLIDDISSGFNGSATTFALQVAGSAPVPFPKSPQQVLISVNGVIQEPDPTGSSGFNLVGTNIVFSSAPTNGHAFFGIIYATADYLNSGGNFPSGSTGAPSLTFVGDEDTGIYRKGSGSIGFVSNSTEIANTDSNGITISSGNLILPADIIHSGDTDTKIRFPSADTFSVETGGAERLSLGAATVFNETGADVDFRIEGDTQANLFYVDAGNNRVGIGTNSPTNQLHVYDSTAANDTPEVKIESFRPSIRFKDRSSSSASAEIVGDDSLIFRVSTPVDDNTALTERMRIDSSGNVGIGTTSPALLAHVSNSYSAPTGGFGSNAFFLVSNNSSSSSNCGMSISSGTAGVSFIQFGDTDDANIGSFKYDNNANSFAFDTNATERMRIDSSGNVGIGTSTPNTKLDVRDSSGTGISSRSTATQSTDTNKGLRVRNNSDTDTFSVSYKGEVYFAGRLGIGETDPDVSIHVKKSSPRIQLEDTGTNAIFRINADSSVGNAALDVDINSATSSPNFKVNIKGTEMFNIDSIGDITQTGHLNIPDNKKIKFGEGNDMTIGHISGTNTIDISSDLDILHGSENVASFNDDGAVVLYHNNELRLVTMSNGVQVERDDSGVDALFTVKNNDSDAASDAIVRISTTNTTAHSILQFGDSGDGNSGEINYDHNNVDMTFVIHAAARMEMDSGAFHPLQSSIDLGRNTGNSVRWDNLYIQNNPSVSSDRNEKNTIVASDLGLDFINKLKPVSYKFNDGESGRTHYGMIAQDIETLLSEIGKTTKEFAGFVKTTATDDGKGNSIDPYDSYALRYSEFISPIIKAIQELSAKVSALEAS